MNFFSRTPVGALLFLILAGVGNGCSFGPKALQRSHGRYLESVQRVDEEQLLRNIVRMRYHESPGTLDVSAIAAQYELSGSAEARPFFSTEALGAIGRSFSTVLPDAQVSAANRPTITFTPSDDSESAQRFLSPITSDTMILLTETSWPVSTILRLWVERINGVPNAPTASGPQRDLPPDYARFLRIAELMQTAQDRELLHLYIDSKLTEISGPLPAEAVTAAALTEAAKNNFEYRPKEDGKTWALFRRERRLQLDMAPQAEKNPEIQELAQLLNLKLGQKKYDLLVTSNQNFDPLLNPSGPSTEVRVSPRSTAQVLFFLANGVAVPPEHVATGLVRLGPQGDGAVSDLQGVSRGVFEVHVCKGHKPPAHAFVAIPYRGYWYFIDDRDRPTKDTFALMLQLSRLDFRRQRGGAPVLTLPAGR